MSTVKCTFYFAVLFLLVEWSNSAFQSGKRGQAKKCLCEDEARYVLQKLHYLTTDFTLYGQRFLAEKQERKFTEKKILKEFATVAKKNQIHYKKIRNKLTKADKALISMQTNISALSTTRSDEIRKMATQILDLKSDVAQLKKTQEAKRRIVSFSAYMKSGLRPTRYQNIPFKGIRSNTGGAYRPSTGIFTAPVNGLYYFHCSILSNIPGEYVLLADGKSRMYLITDDRGSWDHSSNAVILYLKKGKKVFIRPGYHRRSKYFYVHHSFSTFNGFLMQEK